MALPAASFLPTVLGAENGFLLLPQAAGPSGWPPRRSSSCWAPLPVLSPASSGVPGCDGWLGSVPDAGVPAPLWVSLGSACTLTDSLPIKPSSASVLGIPSVFSWDPN